MILRLIKLCKYPIFEQLKLEEAIMRLDKRSNIANIFLNNGTRTKCVVMGSGAKADEVLHLENVRQDNLPVLRRFTGGGTVVVSPKTAFVSFVASNEFLAKCTFPHEESEESAHHSRQNLEQHAKDVEKNAIANVATDADMTTGLDQKKKRKVFLPYPKDIMLWTEHFYRPIFPSHLNFSLLENDYVFGRHKFGGNAQYVTGGTHKRFTHHTSFLWDYDRVDMDRYLKMPSKRPAYRSDRHHDSFLTRMCDSLKGEYAMQENEPNWFLNRVEKRITGLCASGGEWEHFVERIETVSEDDNMFMEIRELLAKEHLSRTYWYFNTETGHL